MAYEIQLRRDTAANWTSANPTLASGEAGYETDTGKLKIGDGSTAWTSLAYFGGTGGVTSLDSITGAVSLVAGSNVTITDNSPAAGDITIAASGGGGGSSVVAYGTQTATTTATGTTFATGTDILTTALSFTADGTSSYAVILMGPSMTNSGANTNIAAVNLDGSLGPVFFYADVSSHSPVSGQGTITPASGSHTVNARVYVTGGTATLLAQPDLTGSQILVYVLNLG